MGAAFTDETKWPCAMARTAGALWLICVGAGIYAEVFVRGSLIVHANAAATAAKIMAAEPLFRLGFAADLIGDMAYLGTTILLYMLLKPVSRAASLLMLGFGLAGSAVMAANLVNFFAPLVLANSTSLATGAPSALMPLILVFLRLHSLGYSMSIALFSVQVAAIGYLILRSSLFPRVFGALFIIEAVCNTVSSFGGFLDLDWVERLGTYLLLPGLPAEGGFALWLLAFGVNAERWFGAQRKNWEEYRASDIGA